MQLGILGGTFDPVHNGHLHIAREVGRLLDLDRILFMVSNYPPHKGMGGITGAYHRFAMVAISLLEENQMLACGSELSRTGPSYTIETLDGIAGNQTKSSICFIAGSDSLKEIHFWRDYDRLFADYCLIFVQRPGAEVSLANLDLASDQRNRIKKVSKTNRFEIRPGTSFILDLEAPPFSSSAIRGSIGSGLQVPPDSLSPQVLSYIRKHRLYEK